MFTKVKSIIKHTYKIREELKMMNDTCRSMGNTIGFESRGSIVNGALIISVFGAIEANHPTRPPPSLQMHILVAMAFIPPLSLLIHRVFRPRGGEIGGVDWSGEKPQEGGECEVMVAAEEDMALIRVIGGERNEEIKDFLGVGASVAVIAQEDN